MDYIRIRGARTHNLKNINLDLPRHRLIVITGLSGSGKSSLAFDTLYAEGQRRYVESLSAYARQFLQLMEKPDVDLIEGLSPAISIEQKATSHNPRSTVGTVTEIHDYLRLLFARVGEPLLKARLDLHAVDHDIDVVLLRLLQPGHVGRFIGRAVDAKAHIALRLHVGEQVAELALAVAHHRRQHHQPRVGR